MLVAVSDATAGHLFTDAALLQECLFVVLDKVAQHQVNLADEGDGNVADHFIGTVGQDAVIVFSVVVFTATAASIVIVFVARFP